MLRFGLVGVSGMFVNQGLLVALHGRAGVVLPLASALAIEASILSNFVLNRRFTWGHRHRWGLREWLRRTGQYHVATAISAFLGNFLVLMALVRLLGTDYRIANLVGMGVGAAANYLASELWVFRAAASSAGSGSSGATS
jgi:dolichol-phosphate mannosyltransferase